MVKLSSSLCTVEQIDTSVNYIVNGDFENPNLGSTRWRVTTIQLPGWSSLKVEHGVGSVYNFRWGNVTQVI